VTDKTVPETMAPGPPGPPFTEFARIALQPDTGLYIGRDDELLVRMRSSQGNNVTVRARLQQPGQRTVVPQHFSFTSSSDRLATTGICRLAEGFLLGVEVLTTATTLRRGVCFVELSFMRGGQTSADRVQKLLSGYLQTGQTLAWPGGDLEDPLEGQGALFTNTSGNPAAGVETTLSVSTAARFRFNALRATLVTDATVAARRVHLVVDDGATIFYDLAAADTQAASLTRNYNFVPEGFQRTAQDSEIYVPIPADLRLLQGWRVRTLTTLLAAGDDWSALTALQEQWLEE
jgi:hypothetical protein